MKKIYTILIALIAVLSITKNVHASELPRFTFEELVLLSKSENNSEALDQKVNKALNNPFVDNSINTAKKYSPMKSPQIGPFLRIASWNVARGMNLDKIKLIFNDPNKLLELSNEKLKKNDKKLEEIKNQIDILKTADIIFLDEVDIGMPRTKYRNVPKELAETIGYNYAFGLEFLEVDPVHLGIGSHKWSEENFLAKDGEIDEDLTIDKEKYRGLHGNAILSRFPLENVRIIRLPKFYDWHKKEQKEISVVENTKRGLAKKLFNENMLREIRVGSRIALVADVKTPSTGEKITLICTHVENRTKPKNRAKQVKYFLKQLETVDNPIVMAGDFNTTMADGSSTSITKEVGKKITNLHFIGKTLLLYGNPYSLAISATSGITHFIRSNSNPTVISIPFFSPNSERSLFNTIRNFEFDDKTVFDMRGNSDKSTNNSSDFLANSNERKMKGFVPSFIFNKNYGVMKYKLDWIFVKAYAHSNSKKESYKMAPHFGKTLIELNLALDSPISDHAPISVDLPLTNYEKEKQNKSVIKIKLPARNNAIKYTTQFF